VVVKLHAGEFRTGQSWTAGDGKYVFQFDISGILTLRDIERNLLLWQSGTLNATRFVVHEDGNLAIYLGKDRLWASDTSGNPGAFLAVQDDGNVVLYSSTFAPLWSTNTSSD